MYKEYIEREALFRTIENIPDNELLGNDNTTFVELPTVLDIISEQPIADVQEVIRCKDEKCVICNSEIDEKYADGLWDLAGEICKELIYDYGDEQDIVYNILRNFIERQNYCPRCGAKMDKE